MKTPLSILKFFKTKKLATAYHEAGHCVVAAVFSDKLFLKELSVNKEYMSKINTGYTGGLHLEWYNIPDQTDHESADHLILIALAGICAKTLYTKGTSFVNRNIDQFRNNSDLLVADGASDDYEIVESYSKPLAQILNTKKSTIEWSAFRWVFEFLLDSEIWTATKIIAEEIIKHPNQTLNGREIIVIIEKSGLRYILNDRSHNFLSKRYPLSIQNLKI